VPRDSSRIDRLRAELAGGAAGTMDAFWDEIAITGAPLVEPGADGNDRVTFLWQGDAGRVAVVGGIGHWDDLTRHEAARIPGTDVWHHTIDLPSDARALYWFSVDDPATGLHDPGTWAESQRHWRLDPYNPTVFTFPYDEEVPFGTGWAGSLLQLREAQVATHAAGDLVGELHMRRVRSTILGNERRVWIYRPPAAVTVPDCPVVLFLDGYAYAQVMAAPTILGNLITAGQIPPVVAVFVDSLGAVRDIELCCHEPFARFLTEELLPSLRADHSFTADPGQTVVAGSSFGGLTAAYLGLSRPDVFGAALSQSGSFWWSPPDDPEQGHLVRRFAAAEKVPLRLHLEVGRLETGQHNTLAVNRALRDVLTTKGCSVSYRETGGAHHHVCWQAGLADGLVALLR
jgi:enterochelin esterase-like enzyme